MTTIAVTATEIAWDSQATRGNIRTVCPNEKVTVIGRTIYGPCGEAEACELLPFWHANGCRKKNMPEGDWSMLVVNRYGVRYYSGDNPHGHFVSAPTAIGSGGEIALTALHLGSTAIEAVQIAAQLDVFTGGEIKSLSIQDVLDGKYLQAIPRRRR